MLIRVVTTSLCLAVQSNAQLTTSFEASSTLHHEAQSTFMGYAAGPDTAQRFGERLFGFYDESVGRMNITADLDDGYEGLDLFGRDFRLVTSVEYTAPLTNHDTTLTVWMGIAQSAWSSVPVPVSGVIVSSTHLNQRRFVPIATLNSEEGLVWMEELRERILNFGPRIARCHMPEPYNGRLQQGRMQYGQCVDEKMSSMWSEVALCIGIGGAMCLFPPTAVFACPLLPVCLAGAGYCGISGHYRAGTRFDNFYGCLCESAASGWDADGCSFECPDCSLPLIPSGGG